MGLSGPFIVENGGAIFIPDHHLNVRDINFVQKGPYQVVELGLPYADLCRAWKGIKKKGNFRMKGFNEMSAEEIADCSGLPLEEASLAAKREYTEPFMFSDTPAQFRLLTSLSQEKGLTITRGGT
jgi:mannosyl-3-phosphoglycerate phosphatase